MLVCFVRHGESECNKEKKLTGWIDAHLTDKGKTDARKAGSIIESINFDKIYSSDLCRARETAEIAIPGCEYETSVLLREIHMGEMAGKRGADLEPELFERVIGYGYKDYGGESIEEFSERIAQFAKVLEAETCGNIAVFTHAGVLQKMMDIVIGTYIPRRKVCCDNCTVAIFQYENGIWKLHSWINKI